MSVRDQAGEETAGGGAARLAQLLEERREAGREFFETQAERIARLCHAMAGRFAAGGQLIAVGLSPAARSDVRHVTVEFVHPVIVGKRALPAIGLTGDGGPLGDQLAATASPGDMVVAFGAGERAGEEVRGAVAAARQLGCLTVAFEAAGAEWELEPPSADPLIRQELTETLYHVLWELVHVFFDHRGLLGERDRGPVHDPGASSFLYPFLAGSEEDLGAVLADVSRSALLKSEETAALREQTLGDAGADLIAAAAKMRAAFEGGGQLLALGNGGSATDATDAVADFRHPPPRGDGVHWQPRRALDLTEDTAIITAVGNDVGFEQVFARQVIAHGREGDVLLALSTSGDSANVIAALAEAGRRGLGTVAMVGYDGGRIGRQGLADHVIISRSQHIPRIQEAQASACHALRELVELAEPGRRESA